jgi:phosphoglycolate phosphatase
MWSVSAAVFDLDGTLVDTIDDIATHLNDSLASRGLPGHSRAQIIRWIGHGADYLVRSAVPDASLAPAVLAEYRERYSARPVVAAQLYPGLDAALDVIARRCKLAVLSNKPQESTTGVAALLLTRWPFVVIAGQRADHPRKPEAAAALEVLRELGCAPGDAVMIGDSDVDISTARNAGMRSIGVAWGFRGADGLADADLLVQTPAELAALFR